MSYGFTIGAGVEKAVRKAKNLRRDHPWALKSDIESFFNRIQRDELKKEISKRLGRRSVVPILHRAIDCEIKIEDRRDKSRLEAIGIECGVGLRQGMPLSPLLSNVVLTDFDSEIVKRGYTLVRYADDFVVFCDSEAQCHEALDLVAALLAKKKHHVPPIAPGSKTVICSPSDPIEFLGFDIVREKASYKIIAPSRVKKRVSELVQPFNSYQTCREIWPTFATALQALNAKLSSFTNAYRIATNFDDLKVHVKNCKRQALLLLVTDIFGIDIAQTVPPERLAFLDIVIE